MTASTICTIVQEVTKTIWDTLNKIHTPVPSKEKFIDEAKNLHLKSGFPHCLGAFDL